jgi:DNA end-binding protein Ku
MAARAIASGTISFGLVSIPVKVYVATQSQHISFNLLEKATGARPKQQYVSSVSGKPLAREEITKGFEYARGQFVELDAEELKALEADRSNAVDIAEFVPLDSIDLVQVEKSYYLGPDKGGDKAYKLLAESMRKSDVVAVARWQARGKEQLVLIRPYRDGLILHQLFYADEVRAYDDMDLGPEFTFSQVEIDLAQKLIEQLSTATFDAEKYRDTYTDKVRELVDQKVAGRAITVTAEPPKAQIIDLFEALKQSLADGKKAPPSERVEAKPVKKAEPRARKAGAKKRAAGD